MTPPGRRTPHGEDGFALIEILVSALVLAIVAAGVMSLLQATTRSAASERRHAEAYAIAQEDQARLRSLRLTYLNRLEQKREVSLDGSSFTVESRGVFINNSTRQPSACTSGTTAADYIRITSTVSWPDSRVPVVMESIVSPSNGSLNPNHGTLTVTVKNAKSEPVAGVGLSGKGPGTFSGSTDSTGCANFADLPAGNYEVTASGTNLVGPDGLAPKAKPIGVSAGTSASLALEYDLGASIPITFEHRVGSGSTFKAATIDSVFFSNELGKPTYWTPTKARETSLTAKPIFPYKNTVSFWSGSCVGNYPGSGAAMASRAFLPGEVVTTPLKLQVPALEITVKNGSSAVSNATVTITDENCNDSSGPLTRTYKTEANGHQSNSSTGQPEYGLPYSTYKICASASYSGTLHRARESGVSVKSLTSTVSKTLSLPSSGSETGSTKTCP